jgi:glutamyl-tRNA synthetase
MLSGKRVTGATAICKTLALEFPKAKLWTEELAQAIEFTLLGSMEKLGSSDPKAITEALSAVNENMTYSMHPVKYAFTVVDLALWGAIKANPQITAAVTSGKYTEIERWYKEIMEQQPIVTQVNKFIHQNNAAVRSSTNSV